jgi:hypothetical protein
MRNWEMLMSEKVWKDVNYLSLSLSLSLSHTHTHTQTGRCGFLFLQVSLSTFFRCLTQVPVRLPAISSKMQQQNQQILYSPFSNVFHTSKCTALKSLCVHDRGDIIPTADATVFQSTHSQLFTHQVYKTLEANYFPASQIFLCFM